MAPNKKKKKPAANPARGFTTTSVPSKIKPDSQADADDPQKDTAGAKSNLSNDGNNTPIGAAVDGQSHSATDRSKETSEMTPEELESHLENAELETLVENHAAKCISDASRQAARLETERRQLRSQAYLMSTYSWFPDRLVDQILEADSSGSDSFIHNAENSHGEERLLLDLWTLERVLEALKLPKVPEAVKHVADLALRGRLRTISDYIPGLYDALQWYAVKLPPSELPDYDIAPGTKPALSGTSTPNLHTSGPTSANTSARSSPKMAPSRDSDIDSLSSASSSDDDGDNDPKQLIEKYLRYQHKLWHAKNPVPGDTPVSTNKQNRKISRYESRIKAIQSDVLFEQDEAESIWRSTLPDLQADRAYRIRTTTTKTGVSDKSEKRATQKTDPENIATTEYAGEEGDDEFLGDMFAAREDVETPTQKDTEEHTTVNLLDFGKFGGISLRKLVEDICKAYDAKSRFQIRPTNNNPHSARHKAEIWWSVDMSPAPHSAAALPLELKTELSTRHWSIEMDRIAVNTKQQSEQYICTLCLFLLSTVGKVTLNFMSRVPATWKEVLKDLNDKRTFLITDEHKSTLRRLRSIVHDVEQTRDSHDTKSKEPRPENPSVLTVRNSRAIRSRLTKLSSTEVADVWQSIISRPLFQQMLHVRGQLPVHQYKDIILRCVAENAVCVICAETGAGKSSGIPVLLLEDDFANGKDCRILVTQPRRISAVTLARRVSHELGEPRNDLGTMKSLVGFAIRLESKTSAATRITYATTGVLLRMLEESPDLEELDYLVLDEVHERTMDLDLLFIALRKLQLRRPTLKIVLMSATVDARKFSNYFGHAPVLDLPGRTFPVEVAFLEDAVEATNDLTDLNDKSLNAQDEEVEFDESETYDKSKAYITDLRGYGSETLRRLSAMDEWRINYNLIAKLAAAIATKPRYQKYSAAILIFMPGLGEIRRLHNVLLSLDTFNKGWIIHLLHSTFSTEELERAFALPPPGQRKIVIATNIAETGITIPDITAVIDSCKEKVMRFDERRQLSRLTEGFISRSSARQRRGRAARVQDGLCFHLVSKHRHDNLMLEQQVPEMLRLSLQDPMLRIKIWDLGGIEKTLSAAIDPPSRKNVIRAIEKLKDAGALTKSEALTTLGQQIARLPLEVSLAKMAIFGVVFRCLDPILAIIALLTSKSPFLSSPGGNQPDARKLFVRGDSDLLSSLHAYESWKRAKISRNAQDFCRKNHISDQSMSGVEETKIQLLVYLVDARLVTFDGTEKAHLSRSRTSGGRTPFYDMPVRFNAPVGDRTLCSILAMALYPRMLAREGKGYRNVHTNQIVSLTGRSVIHGMPRRPNWLSFYEAMQSRSGSLNVFEGSVIPESALATVLGEAEVRYHAGVLALDGGKVKLSLRGWRQLEALRILRERVASALEQAFARPSELQDTECRWLALWLSMEADKEA